jgi:hypothetical protein
LLCCKKDCVALNTRPIFQQNLKKSISSCFFVLHALGFWLLTYRKYCILFTKYCILFTKYAKSVLKFFLMQQDPPCVRRKNKQKQGWEVLCRHKTFRLLLAFISFCPYSLYSVLVSFFLWLPFLSISFLPVSITFFTISWIYSQSSHIRFKKHKPKYSMQFISRLHLPFFLLLRFSLFCRHGYE